QTPPPRPRPELLSAARRRRAGSGAAPGLGGSRQTMIKLFGGILLAVGILIAGASGICSLYGIFSSLNDPGTIPLALPFGGIPFAIGVGLALAGRALLRSSVD